MENKPTSNPGSFMMPAGGNGAAIKAAMDRRGLTPGVTNQSSISPEAVLPAQMPPMTAQPMPNMEAQPATTLPAPTPPVEIAPAGMPPSAQGLDGPPPIPGSGEAEVISMALANRLNILSGI